MRCLALSQRLLRVEPPGYRDEARFRCQIDGTIQEGVWFTALVVDHFLRGWRLMKKKKKKKKGTAAAAIAEMSDAE